MTVQSARYLIPAILSASILAGLILALIDDGLTDILACALIAGPLVFGCVRSCRR